MRIVLCKIKEQLSDIWKIVFYIALILIVVVIGYFIGNPSAANGMIIGCIVGLVCHWRATARASLCIDNTYVNNAEIWLENKGYTYCDESNEFIPNAHRLLRFDSQNVQFSRINSSSTNMIGPYYMLKMFAKTL